MSVLFESFVESVIKPEDTEVVLSPSHEALTSPVHIRRLATACFLSCGIELTFCGGNRVQMNERWDKLCSDASFCPALQLVGDVELHERKNDPLIFARDTDTLYVVFRATDSWKDILTDAYVLGKQLKGYLGDVHGGFLHRADTVPTSFFTNKLDEVDADKSHPQPNHIVLCGHSLGGAAAVVKTLQLLVDTEFKAKWRGRGDDGAGMHCITFGSPFAIGKSLAEHLRQTPIANIFWHFFNPQDPVPAFSFAKFHPMGHYFYTNAAVKKTEPEPEEPTNDSQPNKENNVVGLISQLFSKPKGTPDPIGEQDATDCSTMQQDNIVAVETTSTSGEPQVQADTSENKIVDFLSQLWTKPGPSVGKAENMSTPEDGGATSSSTMDNDGETSNKTESEQDTPAQTNPWMNFLQRLTPTQPTTTTMVTTSNDTPSTTENAPMEEVDSEVLPSAPPSCYDTQLETDNLAVDYPVLSDETHTSISTEILLTTTPHGIGHCVGVAGVEALFRSVAAKMVSFSPGSYNVETRHHSSLSYWAAFIAKFPQMSSETPRRLPITFKHVEWENEPSYVEPVAATAGTAVASVAVAALAAYAGKKLFDFITEPRKQKDEDEEAEKKSDTTRCVG